MDLTKLEEMAQKGLESAVEELVNIINTSESLRLKIDAAKTLASILPDLKMSLKKNPQGGKNGEQVMARLAQVVEETMASKKIVEGNIGEEIAKNR